ncbi:hypothetical protein [Sphaerisporangium dianthi]|uniref:Uncharacterized protein n=1 Tax=Sphaerisporangium dianthi TaxID=1436120 RepID=A0ABV9CFT2_9ACTN
MSTFVSHRMRARVVGLLMVLVSAAALVVATGAPAGAAACATNAHVYANGGFVKYETDPIDGPVGTIYVPYYGVVRFGGNGLKQGEDPFWDVYRESNGAYVATFVGTRTRSNCVSNEIEILARATPGNYIVRATYEPGNSGGVVRNQAHVRLIVY